MKIIVKSSIVTRIIILSCAVLFRQISANIRGEVYHLDMKEITQMHSTADFSYDEDPDHLKDAEIILGSRIYMNLALSNNNIINIRDNDAFEGIGATIIAVPSYDADSVEEYIIEHGTDLRNLHSNLKTNIAVIMCINALSDHTELLPYRYKRISSNSVIPWKFRLFSCSSGTKLEVDHVGMARGNILQNQTLFLLFEFRNSNIAYRINTKFSIKGTR